MNQLPPLVTPSFGMAISVLLNKLGQPSQPKSSGKKDIRNRFERLDATRAMGLYLTADIDVPPHRALVLDNNGQLEPRPSGFFGQDHMAAARRLGWTTGRTVTPDDLQQIYEAARVPEKTK